MSAVRYIIQHFGAFFSILAISLMVFSCSPKRKSPKDRSLKDVENAITIILDRREAEKKVITDQMRQIESLEENIERSTTEGMKEKIRKDIAVKRLAIDKAQKNMANQTEILERLEITRDSLEAIEGR